MNYYAKNDFGSKLLFKCRLVRVHARMRECMCMTASTSHHTTKPTPYALKTYVEEMASQGTVH